ncbi:MAG TPA: L-threonine 3-dehydrogenase [Lentibacillus sp.]|uniref:L-threonine 3-dehydrogenase n=1 Tax=Lentibacillus sp. TaxID=1925746 RepID=UPI002B4AD60F|nr:L-threonine 3-dehydrogenase [Lentibacillus sp.]HLR60814.1 L-threonine 3-dehydrogenase [Lentibacillus sp.]
MKKILVTGAMGQIGSELVENLRENYGSSNVVGSDLWKKEEMEGPFEIVDVTDGQAIHDAAKKHNVDTIMHLAALLSAKAESAPQLAWDLNMGGLINALEAARELDLQFFTPSSIGAFGPTTPKRNTPQETIMRPTTMYGVNKVAGELLCDYYYFRYGLDTRGVRYPGLISCVTPPGGGTTDYAVEIYHEAMKYKKYTSYIAENTYMDMMYMPDALNAIIKLMEADPDKLVNRNAYNISAISAAPEDFGNAIRKHIPEFELNYNVDPVRQQIAESWPDNIDSSAAKAEWGFEAAYDIDKMTEDMLAKLRSI